MGGNRFVERAVTDEIMYGLMRMSGREYVDVYASSLKKGVPSGSRPDTDRVPESVAS
jgi:1-acyl-sn-glycerol-3-phosphate acyltransferase